MPQRGQGQPPGEETPHFGSSPTPFSLFCSSRLPRHRRQLLPEDEMGFCPNPSRDPFFPSLRFFKQERYTMKCSFTVSYHICVFQETFNKMFLLAYRIFL